MKTFFFTSNTSEYGKGQETSEVTKERQLFLGVNWWNKML